MYESPDCCATDLYAFLSTGALRPCPQHFVRGQSGEAGFPGCSIGLRLVYNWPMRRSFVVLAVVPISAVLFACNSEPEHPTPTVVSTPTTISRREHINLANQSWRRSAMHADAGDRVEVTIEIWQQKGGYARCGEPLVRDVTGNVLAVLSPEVERRGINAYYRYEFVAAESGQYTVELLNQGCDITKTPASAILTWTVHKVSWLHIP